MFSQTCLRCDTGTRCWVLDYRTHGEFTFISQLVGSQYRPLHILLHPRMQSTCCYRTFSSSNLQLSLGSWFESRSDHVHTMNDHHWSSYGTTPKPPPLNALSAVVLVHTWVQLLCSHLCKQTSPKGKTPEFQFKLNKHLSCENTLKESNGKKCSLKQYKTALSGQKGSVAEYATS